MGCGVGREGLRGRCGGDGGDVGGVGHVGGDSTIFHVPSTSLMVGLNYTQHENLIHYIFPSKKFYDKDMKGKKFDQFDQSTFLPRAFLLS